MLRVIRDPSLDRLLDHLLRRIGAKPLPAPQQEIVVVQGRGIERWISQQAALRQGAWGFVETLFPRHFSLRTMAAVLDGRVPARAVDESASRQVLAWRIAARLPGLLGDPRFEPVARYVKARTADMTGNRRREVLEREACLALAGPVTDVLDRCALHRPEWVSAWYGGAAAARGGGASGAAAARGGGRGDVAWLAELWRQALDADEITRLIRDRERFLEACAFGEGAINGLPPRVAVFGVATLATSFLELLEALSRRIEVAVYALWPFVTAARHPLAESWGREAIEFDTLLSAGVERGSVRIEDAQGGARGSPHAAAESGASGVDSGPPLALLGALQRRLRCESVDGPLMISADFDRDDSLQIHACAGPRREVEIAHSQIRRLLEVDASLEPHEIAILTPDLDRYGPIADAVFGARRDRPDGIPFTVADRDEAYASVAEPFIALLELALGRCEREAVLGALSLPAIAARFALGAADLERLREWCRGAGVRWGLSEEHRARCDRPGEFIGTWRWGVERLLLGAIADPRTDTALGIGADGDASRAVAPAPGVEGRDQETLHSLLSLLEAIEPVALAGETAKPMLEWIELFERVFEQCVSQEPPFDSPAAGVRARIGALAAAVRQGGFVDAAGSVRARAAVSALIERLREGHPGRGLLASGVTIAALHPMRSIPFRVVVVLGMNGGEFPRMAARPGFDPIAAEPRPGDRDQRLDDRQVLLEVLLGASRAFIMTYTGFDAGTGVEQPPSTMVEELVEAVLTDAETAEESREEMRRRLICSHPVHGFSARYRDPELRDRRIFTYDPAARVRSEMRGGAASGAGRGAPAHADSVPVGAARTIDPALTLDELIRFLKDPARAYCRRLGAVLEWEERSPAEEEAIDVEPAARKELMRSIVAGRPDPVVTASGLLPMGLTGRAALTDLAALVASSRALIMARARELGAVGPEPARRDFTLTIDPLPELAGADAPPIRLDGAIELLEGLGPFRITTEEDPRGRPAEVLRAWVEHLAASVGERVTTLVAGPAGAPAGYRSLELAPIEGHQALQHLRQLVSLWWRGQSAPLPFTRETILRYAHHRQKRDPETPDGAVREVFKELVKPGDERPGFEDLEALRLVWRTPEGFLGDRGPLGFRQIAELIGMPMEAARRAGAPKASSRTGGAKGSSDSPRPAGRGARKAR